MILLKNCTDMKLQVNQGQNIIKLLMDGFSSCLVIEKALIVNWPDCRGGDGEYYSISNYLNAKREKLTTQLGSVLNYGSENEILESLNTFINLFSDGEYLVFFYNMEISNHSFLNQNQVIYSEIVPENERFSCAFFPFPFENQFVFNTIPNHQINPDRVDFYVDLINQGNRPKVLITESFNFKISNYSSSYILDGHHKLEAYLKLGIDIPTVKISKQDSEANDTEEILHYIKPILKDFEFDHYLKNNDDIVNVKFRDNLSLTHALDHILQNDKNPGPDIGKVLINAANSQNELDLKWFTDRLNILKTNKYIGKGLLLYYKGWDDYHKCECGLRLEIKNLHDIKLWLKHILKIKPNILDLFLSNFWF